MKESTFQLRLTKLYVGGITVEGTNMGPKRTNVEMFLGQDDLYLYIEILSATHRIKDIKGFLDKDVVVISNYPMYNDYGTYIPYQVWVKRDDILPFIMIAPAVRKALLTIRRSMDKTLDDLSSIIW